MTSTVQKKAPEKTKRGLDSNILISCRTSFSMESGFLYPEAVFPISAKNATIQCWILLIFLPITWYTI